ncbi:MAG: hypothetical protein IT294_17350 [Deltaproteobacteria bacterium]|nr:hypothetical protein [Deltaproteobacteria bacterium]
MLVPSALIGGAAAQHGLARTAPAVAISTVHPTRVDPQGGTRVVVRGSGLAGVRGMAIGGAPARDPVVLDDGPLSAR